MVEKMIRKKIFIRKKNEYEKQQEDMLFKINQMKYLFEKKQIISFGFNCFVKIMLQKMKIEQETHFFDWIGTSLWTLRVLLQNDFDSILEKDKLQYIQTVDEELGYVWTDVNYYIRLKHDFNQTYKKNTNKITEKQIVDTQHKYQRRKKRLLETFQECESKQKPVLFLRLEEDPIDRMNHDQYHKYEPKDEMTESLLISAWLQKKYPQLIFHICLISRIQQKESFVHPDDPHILILCKKEINKDLIYHVPTMIDMFYENKEFLEKYLLIDNISR
jgi:hypothetical protein